jgi:hypothetical protein
MQTDHNENRSSPNTGPGWETLQILVFTATYHNRRTQARSFSTHAINPTEKPTIRTHDFTPEKTIEQMRQDDTANSGIELNAIVLFWVAH